MARRGAWPDRPYPDLLFFFDPVCPFAWMTSQWVRQVCAQRNYQVEWRFISLRLLNAHIDYATHFPPEYEAGHTAGLKLLRVAARLRAEHGPAAVGPFYQALGTRIWETDLDVTTRADRAVVVQVLTGLGLDPALADALEEDHWDAEIGAEGESALALTGRDVGTPILQFQPPDGVAFFGPVISRLPRDEDAVALWDHVVGLASFGGFAELKRSLRELPQLRALGVGPDVAGVEQDWHAGSRRLKR